MTRKKIVKSLSDRIATEVGCFASISEIARITGYSRSKVAEVVKSCEPFGDSRQRKFFCDDIAEAFARGGF